jgi:hypoxanthine phosphoribosyltransferase
MHEHQGGVSVDEAIGSVLVSREELQAKVAELGALISADYAGKELLLVGVLKGAVFFMADLARHITVPVSLDFMAVSSYGSSTDSSGVVRILKDLDTTIEGRHVLVVEDIIDSGLTLSYLMKNLRSRRPASLEVCALLTKPSRRRVEIRCRYIGFEIPNLFVVGYGLDLAERYRTLDYVASLREDVIAELIEAEDALL